MKFVSNNAPIAVSASTTSAVLGLVNIAQVYWYNPVTIGDTVTLQDDLGNILWQGRCEVAAQSEVFKFPAPFLVSGYQVPTLTSGTLYLYRV